MDRQITVIGRVSGEVIEEAKRSWHADVTDEPAPGLSTLVLFNTKSPTAQYIDMLATLDRAECPVGVLPIVDGLRSDALHRLLTTNTIHLNFDTCHFRFFAEPLSGFEQAPSFLTALHPDDQEQAVRARGCSELLVLQGHAGPLDGGFGSFFTLCSRNMHQAGHTRVFSCLETSECFRQRLYGRPAEATEGLVDPADLRAKILIIDGCGVLPMPGSLYGFETSIASAVMASRTQVSVLTHGVSASQFSSFVVLLAMLGKGESLGCSVREANRHGRIRGCATSLFGDGIAPWIVLGNPDIRVTGIPFAALQANPDGVSVDLDAEMVPQSTGLLAVVSGVTDGHRERGAFITTGDARWARAATHGGDVSLWIGGQPSSTRGPVRLSISTQSSDLIPLWRRRWLWFEANQRWFQGCLAALKPGGIETTALSELKDRWTRICAGVERLLRSEIESLGDLAQPMERRATQLKDVIAKNDLATARLLASVAPIVGGSLYRFGASSWSATGDTVDCGTCNCGSTLCGEVLRHVMLPLARVRVRCPACGHFADTPAAEAQDDGHTVAITPSVVGVPLSRTVSRGAAISLLVRSLQRLSGGAVAATLFDPFLRRRLGFGPNELSVPAEAQVSLTLPSDWPVGMSQLAAVISVAGELSFLEYDVLVS